MELLRAFMRFFSYVYHGLLALFLLAITFLSIATEGHRLRLDMLPWKGAALAYWVFFGALFGLVTVLLAFKGKARILFLIWSVTVALFLLKGYVFSSYYFARGEISTAVLLIVGALLSILGAWFQFRTVPMKKKYY